MLSEQREIIKKMLGEIKDEDDLGKRHIRVEELRSFAIGCQHLSDVFKTPKILSPSEALFGFVGWLTTREDKTVISSSSNCAGLPDLVELFCKINNLPEPINGWEENLTHPTS